MQNIRREKSANHSALQPSKVFEQNRLTQKVINGINFLLYNSTEEEKWTTATLISVFKATLLTVIAGVICISWLFWHIAAAIFVIALIPVIILLFALFIEIF